MCLTEHEYLSKQDIFDCSVTLSKSNTIIHNNQTKKHNFLKLKLLPMTFVTKPNRSDVIF